MTNQNVLLVIASAWLIAGCSGGSSSSGDGMGTIRIGLTDAPIDDVSVVNVEFTGVYLKPVNGSEIEIIFDQPKNFDLLRLVDGATVDLLEQTSVPVGDYNWIRLAVNAEFDNVFDSYAMIPTGQIELRVPSGGQSGLKLVSGFTVTQGGSTNIVLDWDLRRALTMPQGQPGWHLRPALRVTNMAEYGTLTGTVDPTLITEEKGCTSDLATDSGNAVYIYFPATDVAGDMGDAENDPFLTATVAQDNDGNYSYTVNYLSVGEYSASFTCQANDDIADVDEMNDEEILLTKPQRFMIEDGVTKIVNF